MSSRVNELETSRIVSHSASRGTIIRHVLDVVENLRYSVSYTTRAPRPGQVDGREYFFVNRDFEEMASCSK